MAEETVNAICGKCYIQESRFFSQAGISQNVFQETMVSQNAVNICHGIKRYGAVVNF